MRTNPVRAIIAANFLLLALCTAAPAQEESAKGKGVRREVAVTFDDLIWQGPPLTTPEIRSMTEKLLRSTKANRVPVFADVNESKLYQEGRLDPARVAILKMWLDAGAELGNHTYSHLALNADHSLASVEEDLIRG